MELSLDQALQKGVEAHKAGKAQEADQYYTAILKANPKHPDANHNMGVLAVGVGKVQEALPFFKTALEANASIAQFWLSYIDALIKLDRIADAKAVLDQAKSTGLKGEGFDQIEKQLNTSSVKLKNTTQKDILLSLGSPSIQIDDVSNVWIYLISVKEKNVFDNDEIIFQTIIRFEFDNNGKLISKKYSNKDDFIEISFSKNKTQVITENYGITDQIYESFTRGQ